jgi:general secretion pathway protein A
MPFQRAQASYDEHYGFREAPFSLTPDPKFVYSSPSHERALNTILYALGRREGLIVVTGDIGCGKTTLCRRLLPLLPPRTFLSLVLNPFLAADDLLKQVLEDFGLVSAADVRGGSLARASCHELARTLQEFLNSLAQMNGTAVIIVDEAQNLPLRTLEQIRLLSNFETDTTKLLQIILVGQRNLEPILELEEMRQLKQRVSRRCRVVPLSPPEVAGYVECRLAAGMPEGEPPRVHFTSSALAAVARLSDGVPRIINLLCDRALEFGQTTGSSSIDRRVVVEAARDLELPVPAALRFAPVVTLRPALARVAAGVALVAAVWLVLAKGPWPVWSDAIPRSSTATATTRQPAPAARPSAPPATDTKAAAATAPPAEVASKPSAPDTESVQASASVVQTADSYELRVASFETAGRAAAVTADLVAHGHPARVAASGDWNLVIVGPYSSMAEAEVAKETLSKSGFPGIRIAKSQ